MPAAARKPKTEKTEQSPRGVAGAAKFALPFKSVEQCDHIGRRLAALLGRKGRTGVVIVGGGLEGVEALGEILRRYRRHPGLEIHLIENKKRLLSNRPKALERDIRKICKPFNVQFHTDTRVTKISGNKVWLSSRVTLNSDVTIWTGGAVPSPHLHKSGLTKHPGDWAPVNKGRDLPGNHGKTGSSQWTDIGPEFLRPHQPECVQSGNPDADIILEIKAAGEFPILKLINGVKKSSSSLYLLLRN
jgi:hypothetical protein